MVNSLKGGEHVATRIKTIRYKRSRVRPIHNHGIHGPRH